MSEDLSILEFDVDISEQEAPPPLPVGDYEVECIESTKTTSKNSGNPMIVTKVRINPDDFPADFVGDDYPEGITLTAYTVCRADSARDRWNVRKLCEAFGVVPSKQVDLTEFLGERSRVTIGHEEYEGMMNARIQGGFKPI